MILRILTVFLFVFTANAHEWKNIKIPGAKCGDGKDYSIFIQTKSQNKILVEFMGGGVCWDYNSCFENVSIFPWLHPYPLINSYSVATSNNSKINPFKEHSKIYFPYCTGDVHSGNHLSQYKDKKVYHYGKRNIDLAVQYLKDNSILSLDNYKELVIYGTSAGGIASLVHGKNIETLFPNLDKKFMIVDSPGLHFGENFWKKFDESMFKDFDQAFINVNLYIDYNDGFVAKKMAPVLDLYNDWTIGFIYGLKDQVMSEVFGEISKEKHKELILSSEGLPAVAKDFKNIHFWLGDTSMHTFYLSRYTARMKSIYGETVEKFISDLYYNK